MFLRKAISVEFHHKDLFESGSFLNKFQNYHFDVPSESSSERFLRMGTSKWPCCHDYHLCLLPLDDNISLIEYECVVIA